MKQVDHDRAKQTVERALKMPVAKLRGEELANLCRAYTQLAEGGPKNAPDGSKTTLLEIQVRELQKILVRISESLDSINQGAEKLLKTGSDPEKDFAYGCKYTAIQVLKSIKS